MLQPTVLFRRKFKYTYMISYTHIYRCAIQVTCGQYLISVTASFTQENIVRYKSHVTTLPMARFTMMMEYNTKMPNITIAVYDTRCPPLYSTVNTQYKQHEVCVIGLCNNRNSPITIMLLIITIVPCMHEIPQNIIKYSSLCCSLYAIQFLVDSVCHQC